VRRSKRRHQYTSRSQVSRTQNNISAHSPVITSKSPHHPEQTTNSLLTATMSTTTTTSSPADTDPPASELPPLGTASTTASSVTSDGPAYSVSPALSALDDYPTPKLRLESTGDEKLASREPVAPVPSDFPGKKAVKSSHIVNKGDFESDAHFYARCCTSPDPLNLLFGTVLMV
jgi:hypothetical protein